MTRKIVLATPSGLPERVVDRLASSGYDVAVAIVESLDPDQVSKIAQEHPDAKIIVPGSSPYDYTVLRGRVVKGSYSPEILHIVLERFGVDALSPSLPAEKAIGPRFVEVFSEVLKVLGKSIGFRNGRPSRIPMKPPPILLASEVYVEPSGSVYNVISEALGRIASGADIIVLGSKPGPGVDGVFLRAAEILSESLDVPLAIDPHHPSLAERVFMSTREILIYMSVVEGSKPPKGLNAQHTVVLPIYTVVSNVRRVSESLLRTCEWGLAEGLNPIVDPVVLRPGAPRGPLSALAGLALARESGLDCPAMAGINNFYELIDADTTGTIAVLALLAGEAGASLVLSSEESTKSMRATLEARLATYMASYSMYTGSPPKDLGFGLLTCKPKDYDYGLASGCEALKLLPRSWAAAARDSTTS